MHGKAGSRLQPGPRRVLRFCSFAGTPTKVVGTKRLSIRMVAVILAVAGVVAFVCGGQRPNHRQAALEVPVGAMAVLSND